MQTLTRTYMIVIEDYDRMTTMDEIVNWMKVLHLLPNFSLDLRVPFCTYTFTSKTLIAFLKVHTRGKEHLSLMYTMYGSTSNNAPFYTHASLYVV